MYGLRIYEEFCLHFCFATQTALSNNWEEERHIIVFVITSRNLHGNNAPFILQHAPLVTCVTVGGMLACHTFLVTDARFALLARQSPSYWQHIPSNCLVACLLATLSVDRCTICFYSHVRNAPYCEIRPLRFVPYLESTDLRLGSKHDF